MPGPAGSHLDLARVERSQASQAASVVAAGIFPVQPLTPFKPAHPLPIVFRLHRAGLAGPEAKPPGQRVEGPVQLPHNSSPLGVARKLLESVLCSARLHHRAHSGIVAVELCLHRDNPKDLQLGVSRHSIHGAEGTGTEKVWSESKHEAATKTKQSQNDIGANKTEYNMKR
jgi:hypothetical protein